MHSGKEGYGAREFGACCSGGKKRRCDGIWGLSMVVMVLRKMVEVLRRTAMVFATTIRGSLMSEVLSAMTKCINGKMKRRWRHDKVVKIYRNSVHMRLIQPLKM